MLTPIEKQTLSAEQRARKSDSVKAFSAQIY